MGYGICNVFCVLGILLCQTKEMKNFHVHTPKLLCCKFQLGVMMTITCHDDNHIFTHKYNSTLFTRYFNTIFTILDKIKQRKFI